MSEDIPAGAAKVLAERIEALCESVDGLRLEVRELRSEVRGEVRDLEARTRRLEERAARDEGSNYGARIHMVEQRMHELEHRRAPRATMNKIDLAKTSGISAGIVGLIEAIRLFFSSTGKGG